MKCKQPVNPQMSLGDTRVSCRKNADKRTVSVADDIEALVGRHPGLTAAEISETLFANENDLHRVNLICRRLIAEGRIRRSGAGTVTDPFKFSPTGATEPLAPPANR